MVTEFSCRPERANNIKNVGEEALKLYTIYGSPHHRNGYVAATRSVAEDVHEEFDGTTTE
jgi:hypothetical protein